MSTAEVKVDWKSKIAILVNAIFSAVLLYYCSNQAQLVIGGNAFYIFLFSIIPFVASSYFVYKFLLQFSQLKEKLSGLWIAYTFSILVIISYVAIGPVHSIEEISISSRFYYLRGGSVKIDENQKNVIERAHKNIQIIGITPATIEGMGWPIRWENYAKVVNAFKDTQDSILMFDIFFMDYKKGQFEPLAEAMTKAKNVMLDYPVYSESDSKSSIQNYEQRMKILRDRYRLKNVTDPKGAGSVWLSLPVPPIEPISSVATGLGFANIHKEEINRKMPLLVKLENSGPNKETEFYPSIDLVIACKYFGVDVVNDTEIVLGEYLKIKNIPNKTIESMNMKTFQVEKNDIMAHPNPKREIVIPIDWMGQMQINFVGGSNSFTVWDLKDVAEWDSETPVNNRMNNHIFLIAMHYATGVDTAKDLHNSPFGEIAGVEHHANAVNTILNQDFLHNLPDYQVVLLFLAIALLVGFVQPRVKTWIGFLFIVVLFVGYGSFAFYAFNKLNLILPLPSILFEMTSIFISIIGLKVFTEEENVKYIKNTFSKFVSSDVVDELLKDPSKIALGGSKREITIFFSDVRGFTTISERLSPEELVKLLNEYLSSMTEIILEYKGTIDKYMGDAIMAFWGAPIELEDHAYYACVASLYQMNYLKKLQEQWKEKNLPVIDIGIGMNTGQAVVGNMGSSHRMEYTCMGDTINLGSRLEGSNKMYGTNIIISEYTYEQVKDRVYARELDLVKVKGKNQPVRIYELVGLVDDSDFEKIKRPLSLSKGKKN